MENVAVVVEDWPRADQLRRPARHAARASTRGPLTARGPMGYAGAVPDRITIFRGPLCARATDEHDARAREVRVTVLHEVGHYFGLADARLRELGWA